MHRGIEASPASSGRLTPEVAAAVGWFAEWACYRAIVDHDWMRHAEITASIRRRLLAGRDRPFTVLDLGCGDADPALQALRDTPVSCYTGVDAAPAALVEAGRRLEGADFAVHLVAADAVEEVARRAARGVASDVILAGYLVHHFTADVKRRFFRACRRGLEAGGELYFFDVHRLAGTTREEYLETFVEDMRAWRPMTDEAFAKTCAHLRAYDFPETEDFILQAAADAGFAGAVELLYADDDRRGFHRLYRFEAAASAADAGPAA